MSYLASYHEIQMFNLITNKQALITKAMEKGMYYIFHLELRGHDSGVLQGILCGTKEKHNPINTL